MHETHGHGRCSCTHSARVRGRLACSVAVFATGLAVRVAVADQGGATEPVLSGSAADAEGGMTGGRGLHIVDILADRWGHRGDVLGRLVWFEVMAKPEG